MLLVGLGAVLHWFSGLPGEREPTLPTSSVWVEVGEEVGEGDDHIPLILSLKGIEGRVRTN